MGGGFFKKGRFQANICPRPMDATLLASEGVAAAIPAPGIKDQAPPQRGRAFCLHPVGKGYAVLIIMISRRKSGFNKARVVELFQHAASSVWVLLRAPLLLNRNQVETRLSKQQFNMLGGSSNLPGKRTHTCTETHKWDTHTHTHSTLLPVLALVSAGFKETT